MPEISIDHFLHKWKTDHLSTSQHDRKTGILTLLQTSHGNFPTPGSFGTYCGVEKNIPTITLELGEDESFEFQKDACFKIFNYLANEQL